MNKYLLSSFIFITLDMFYINFTKNYFNTQIKLVQGTDLKINLVASVIVYAVLIFGLNYFIIQQNKSVKDAFILGLVIYAVYEFTNMSLLQKWKFKTALMDTLWGGILFGLTTFVVKKVKNF
jgi:uncharacterized membrane protein